MSRQPRPYRRADLAGVYQVCATVDATGRGTRCHDPYLPGHVYAGPYLAADPDLGFVVLDEIGVAGYAVATDDTRAFHAWQQRHWWPQLRERYPPRPDPADGTRDHALIDEIHAGPGPDRPWFDSHPAHLHIKLAARLQGRGWGRRLMEAGYAALRARGIPGLHLGVAEANRNALAFYTALGFTQAHRHPWGRTLVLGLTPDRKELPHHPHLTPAPQEEK